MTEVAAGVVEVGVTVAVRGAACVRGDEDTGGRWEGATAEAERTRRYTLADLGFGAPDDPTPAGNAFVALLRAGGRLTHPANDPDLLVLGGVLTIFFQLPDAPLTFDANRGQWTARFEAASFVPASDR